jgi:hypothetical protein
MGHIGSPVCGMLVAGGFCYRMLLDFLCIARESQNAPAPARASDRLLSIWRRKQWQNRQRREALKTVWLQGADGR